MADDWLNAPWTILHGAAGIPPPPGSASGNTAVWPGATQVSSDLPALAPPAPRLVAPAVPAAAPPGRPYPSLPQLTDVIYNETSSQGQTPGGSSLDDVRQAIGHAILNRTDQNVPGKVAPNFMKPEEAGAIMAGILHPELGGANKKAADAWFSSLDAAAGALNRWAAPATGPESGVYYNGRADDSTGPNPSYATNGRPPAPFLGTFGPYTNSKLPWWAFFANNAPQKKR